MLKIKIRARKFCQFLPNVNRDKLICRRLRGKASKAVSNDLKSFEKAKENQKI